MKSLLLALSLMASPAYANCQEVLAIFKAELTSDFNLIGSIDNVGTEVYAFKSEDTGNGAVYIQIAFTTRSDLIDLLPVAGWKVEKMSCVKGGKPAAVLVKVTKARERV